jgi:hypothetical protein
VHKRKGKSSEFVFFGDTFFLRKRKGQIFRVYASIRTSQLNLINHGTLGWAFGLPENFGSGISGFKISGFENRHPKLQRVLQYPKIWVPGISGSGIPELPELLCRLHKNTYTLLN